MLLSRTHTEPRTLDWDLTACTSRPGATSPCPASKQGRSLPGPPVLASRALAVWKGPNRAPLRQRLRELTVSRSRATQPGPAPPDVPCVAPPGPERSHPGSSGCLILLRRRPYLAAAAAPAPAPARALAGAAVLLPARLRAPAAPPRRRTRPAAAAPTAQPQGRGGGASRAPDMTNPASAARRRGAWRIGQRSVRAVKGAAACGLERRGGRELLRVTWRIPSGRSERFTLPIETEELSPALCVS